MTMISALSVMLAVGLVLMVTCYVISRMIRNMGLIDVAWTAGLGLAPLLFLVLPGYPARQWLVVSIVGIWAARLVWYIVSDRVAGKPEDRRYQYLRSYWGDRADRNFLWLFIAEAPLVPLFAVPFLVAMTNPAAGLRWLDVAGVAIWLASITGEVTADRQLARFRANPANRGRTCREGLWRYSRHPNYFFEWIHWWAYVVIAWGSPHWAWTLVGPVGMYLFLRYLTGIPHVEAQALRSRPDYADYQATTNMLIPWPPAVR